MKRSQRVLPYLAAILALMFVRVATAAIGDWDLSYGSNGRIVLANPGASDFFATSTIMQPDGRTLFGGFDFSTGTPVTPLVADYILARVNPDGSPDTSFNGTGSMRITVPYRGRRIALALQKDGKILAAALAYQQGVTWHGYVLLARFNANGTPDNSFGTAGRATVEYGDHGGELGSLAVDDNGSILITAVVNDAPGAGAAIVMRLTPAGAFDTSFGTGGIAYLRSGNRQMMASEIKPLASGAILVAGTLGYAPRTPFIGRLTAAGVPDATFGTAGIQPLDLMEDDGAIWDLSVTNDGKILAAGNYPTNTKHPTYGFIVRWLPNGTFDPEFGSQGRIITRGSATTLIPEADGKIVAAGEVSHLNNTRAWLARYNQDGSPDVSFGVRGETIADFAPASPDSAGLNSVVARAGGGYLAVVLTNHQSPLAFSRMTAAFLASGTSPGAIGIVGKNVTNPLSPVAVSETGDNKLPINIYRTGGASGAVSVQYRVVSGTAIVGRDIAAATGTVTFQDGELGPKTIEVEALDDVLMEDVEDFSVELFAPTGGATLSKPSMTAQVFSEDVGSSVTIPVRDIYVLERAGSVQVRVRREMDLRSPLTISYSTSPATAQAGSDFTTVSGTLSWAAGEGGSKVITVPILDDAIVENEQFVVVLSSPSMPLANSLNSEVATINIVDDDMVPSSYVAFQVSSIAVSESAGSATAIVHRLGDASGALQVQWSADPRGPLPASGADFTATNGVLDWAAGDATPKTISVPILNDAIGELEETFYISLYGNNLGANYATVTIVDDDTPQTTPFVNLSCPSSVSENVMQFACRITVSSLAYGYVSVGVVDAVFSGSATAADVMVGGGAYMRQPGEGGDGFVNVYVTNDDLDEADETFTVKLVGAGGGAQLVNASATVTIVDDDPPGAGGGPLPTVAFANAVVQESENSRTVRLTVTRPDGSNSAMRIPYYTSAGTASTPADYASINRELVWMLTDTSDHVIEIQLNGDRAPEADETFQVVLMDGSPGGIVATVTLVDDDAGNRARVSFQPATYWVNESATSLTLQLARTGNTADAVSVTYNTTAGTATAADFTAGTGTVTWEAGDTSPKSITIALTPDTIDEPDESFTVELRAFSAGAEIEGGPATVTIVDDDGPQSEGKKGGGGGSLSMFMLLLMMALLAERARRRSRARFIGS